MLYHRILLKAVLLWVRYQWARLRRVSVISGNLRVPLLLHPLYLQLLISLLCQVPIANLLLSNEHALTISVLACL